MFRLASEVRRTLNDGRRSATRSGGHASHPPSTGHCESGLALARVGAPYRTRRASPKISPRASSLRSIVGRGAPIVAHDCAPYVHTSGRQFRAREAARQKVTYWSADGDRGVDRPEAPRQIRELNQLVDASIMAEREGWNALERSGVLNYCFINIFFASGMSLPTVANLCRYGSTQNQVPVSAVRQQHVVG